MEPNRIQAKIEAFVEEHPELRLSTDDTILSVMCELGEISADEMERIKSGSIFDSQAETFELGMGLEIELRNNQAVSKEHEEKNAKAIETVSRKAVGKNVYLNTFEAFRILGWDDKGEDADKLAERLSEIPAEIYENEEIGKHLVEILIKYNMPINYKNVADAAEILGITIRSEKEVEDEKDRLAKMNTRLFVQNLLSYMYSSVSEMYKNTEDGLTPVDFGFYGNAVNKLLSKVSGKPMDFKSISNFYGNWAEKFQDMNILNDIEFKKQFKEYFGIEYDEQLIKDNIDILNYPNSKDFNKVCEKVFGFDIQKNAQKSLTSINIASGIGDVTVMLMTLGAANKLKAVKAAKLAAVNTATNLGSKIALKGSEKFSQKMSQFAGKCVRLSGGAVVGGTELGGFELVKGTLGNVLSANSISEFSEQETEVLNHALSSYGFGFFGGIWGQTAVAAVQKAVTRTSSKVASELAPKFAEGGAELSDVITSFVKNSTPTLGAKGAGFLTEVCGFTLYESALEILKNIPEFPDKMSVEDVANILYEQFKGQGLGLGQIKLVSSLIMFMTGSKSAQMASMRYFSEAKEFKGIKVNEVNANGESIYEIKNDKFTLKCKSLDDVITSGIFIARLEGAIKIESKTKADAHKEDTRLKESATEAKPNKEENSVYTNNREMTDSEYQKRRVSLFSKIETDKDFPRDVISDITRNTNKGNISLVEKLCSDKDFPRDEIWSIASNTNKDNISLVEKLCSDKDFPRDVIWKIAAHTNKDNISLVEKLCSDKDFPRDEIRFIAKYTNEDNISLVEKLCSDKDYPRDEIWKVAEYTHKDNISLVEKLCSDKDFPRDVISGIAEYTNEGNISLVEKLCSEENFPRDKISGIAWNTNKDNISLVEKLCSDKNFPRDEISSIAYHTNKDNISLVEKLCSDKDFPRDKIIRIARSTNKDNISLVEMLCSDKDFPRDEIWQIAYYTNKDNISLVEKLCSDKDFPRDKISGIAENTNKGNISLVEMLCSDKDFPRDVISGIAFNTNKNNISLVEKLCSDKDFPRDVISDIAYSTNKDNISLVEKLYSDKDFPRDEISDIAYHTNKDNISLVEKLCSDKDFPRNEISVIACYTHEDNISLVEKLCSDKDFSRDVIRSIAKYTNKDNISLVEKLMESREMRSWITEHIKNGLDVDTVMQLARTQKTLFSEANLAKMSDEAKAKKEAARQFQEQKMKDAANIQADPEALNTITTNLVNDLGVPENMAKNSYAKLCVDSDGNIDRSKMRAMEALIQAFGVETSTNDKGKVKTRVNILPNDIKDIFKLATGDKISNANGIFREQFILDIIILKKSGIDDVKLATNISAVKNMSSIEMKARIRGDVREDLANRIDNLPDKVKADIKSNGINLDNVKDKALEKVKSVEGKTLVQAPEQTIKIRNLDSIVGTERMVLNKFKTDPEVSQIWSDEAAFKRWAEKRLEKISSWDENDYNSKAFPDYNDARREGLKQWVEFLNSDECSVKDDVFAKILFLDGIVSEMKPDNAYTPPAISPEGFEAVYNQILEGNTKVSVTSSYAEINRKKAIKQFGERTKASDGTEGTWVRIPSGGKRGEPEYDEHIAMIQALAEGSAWCLRFENAHNYLEKGDVYFFVDNNGKSQMAINVTPDGTIYEMQRRDRQDGTVPVHLANVINEFITKNNFTGRERAVQSALAAKPEFDRMKSRILEMQANGDITGIFNELGINVKMLSDGTYSISDYSAAVENQPYTLYDLGINEDLLFSNVSEIRGGMNLNNSTLTKAPKLKTIKGELSFGDNKTVDLRALEGLGEHTIKWIKP